MDVPTVAELLASNDVIYDDDHGGRCATVARIGKYVMKYNGRTRVEEADSLRYLAANTNLPVPKCYGSGDTLEKLWPDLATMDKDQVVRQLRDQVSEYRNLPPPDYLGAVVKGPLGQAFFDMLNEDPALGAPFRNAEHFKDVLAIRLGNLKEQLISPKFVEIMRLQMDEALGDFRTVFTHADLSAKNVMVHKQGTNDDGSGVFKVSIIDWEIAGWYPEWWEW
ncbi:unnamed protein product [Zymoseptoria tritici ST99CH_1E4]|uniref:Aminoglycoside phosphotransferase domain-containing protein n=1 Tax=Zymoseptoria tritici ST99CH_1E4 TaxID=1276532 RepID=A0A2H1GHH3_ZYMTR|nr:unnamed protein product [Zymoseptoria tritici ST99CH_1E4]